MEPRKIIVIDNKNQSQSIINDSRATTLGELKSEMRAKGINYEGSAFYCGQMRAELKDDSAPIPETVMYRGQAVRDLTFMLTTPDKKIKSGAMSRAEAYAKIKELGLQEACKNEFGKNFTQCSTTDLISLIERTGSKKPVTKVEAKVETKAPEKPASKVADSCANVCGNCPCEKALKVLLGDLQDTDTIDNITYDECMGILGGEDKNPDKMSRAEINEMFNFVDR